MKPKDVVLAFWKAMGSNDFYEASMWLSEDYVCHWPQSSEIIQGRDNFAVINTNYPGDTKWIFTINSIVCEENSVVTDVSVTDGKLKARAVTFHTVENQLINKQTEFWPDDYEAPQWRRKWVETIE